jgi:hypothetical protein
MHSELCLIGKGDVLENLSFDCRHCDFNEEWMIEV